MQLRSAAVPGRSKVDSAKGFDFSARIGVTIRCTTQRADQSFMETMAFGCLLVAAPRAGALRLHGCLRQTPGSEETMSVDRADAVANVTGRTGAKLVEERPCD